MFATNSFIKQESENHLNHKSETPRLGTKSILVIEDEPDIRDIIVLQLKNNGHHVEFCENGQIAYTHLLHNIDKYDLLLVDWMLPGMSGPTICQKVRQEFKSSVPILMVTARAEPDHIIEGLDAGADDYITKPFEMDVFLARTRALIRRFQKEQGSTPAELDQLKVGNIEIDLKKFKVLSSGVDISLTISELTILKTLMMDAGIVFTRRQLIEKISGPDVHVTGRTIDTHVAGLRKKLGSNGSSIETIRGIGYRYCEG